MDSTHFKVNRILDFLHSVESPIPQPIAFDSIKNRLLRQESDLDAKSRLCVDLSNQIDSLKSQLKINIQEHEKERSSLLDVQRKEYEATILRHLSFIDKLIVEKQNLIKLTSELTGQLEALDKKWTKKTENLVTSHNLALKSAKCGWEIAEKNRREKWMAEKTIVIKQQTAKAMEPEIEQLVQQSKSQIQITQDRCREEWHQERHILLKTHESQMQLMRDRISMERENAAEQEREFAKTRYSKLLESEEIEHQVFKKRTAAEFQQRLDALDQSHAAHVLDLEKSFEQKLLNAEKIAESAKEVILSEMEQLKKVHEQELIKVKLEEANERNIWQNSVIEKLQADIQVREEKFKENLLVEREKEIESIISRLEADSSLSLSDKEKKHREEVENLVSKHQNDVNLLREEWNTAIDKIVVLSKSVDSLQQAKRSLEQNMACLKESLEEKTEIVTSQREKLSHYESTESEMRKSIEKQLEKEMQHKETLLESFKNQTERLTIQNQNLEAKLEEFEKQKIETLDMLEERVKQTVKAKDEVINVLRGQIEQFIK